MDKPRDFLLDTNIILHYARESDVYAAIEQKFHLRASKFSPLVCVVTLGEIRAIAYCNNWEMPKLHRLEDFLSHLVAVDISSPAVIDTYARILTKASKSGWGIHNKQNDLWIASVAHAIGATLMTTDRDFDPLQGLFLDRVLIHAKTGNVLS